MALPVVNGRPSDGEDLGARVGPRSRDLGPGQALIRGARLDTPPRPGIDAEHLHLRLEWRRDLAVEQLLRRVDDEAVVRRHVTRAGSALEDGAVGQAKIDAEVDAVVDLGLFAVVVRQRDDVVLRHDPVGIVEAAHLIAAAIRQAGIDRRRHAVRRVVGRRDVLVVRREEVAVPAAEVSGVHRHARQQLMLNRRRRLPVVAARRSARRRRSVQSGSSCRSSTGSPRRTRRWRSSARRLQSGEKLPRRGSPTG